MADAPTVISTTHHSCPGCGLVFGGFGFVARRATGERYCQTCEEERRKGTFYNYTKYKRVDKVKPAEPE